MAILDAFYSNTAMTLFIKVYSSIEVRLRFYRYAICGFVRCLARKAVRKMRACVRARIFEIAGPDLKTILEPQRWFFPSDVIDNVPATADGATPLRRQRQRRLGLSRHRITHRADLV